MKVNEVLKVNLYLMYGKVVCIWVYLYFYRRCDRTRLHQEETEID